MALYAIVNPVALEEETITKDKTNQDYQQLKRALDTACEHLQTITKEHHVLIEAKNKEIEMQKEIISNLRIEIAFARGALASLEKRMNINVSPERYTLE